MKKLEEIRSNKRMITDEIPTNLKLKKSMKVVKDFFLEEMLQNTISISNLAEQHCSLEHRQRIHQHSCSRRLRGLPQEDGHTQSDHNELQDAVASAIVMNLVMAYRMNTIPPRKEDEELEKENEKTREKANEVSVSALVDVWRIREKDRAEGVDVARFGCVVEGSEFTFAVGVFVTHIDQTAVLSIEALCVTSSSLPIFSRKLFFFSQNSFINIKTNNFLKIDNNNIYRKDHVNVINISWKDGSSRGLLALLGAVNLREEAREEDGALVLLHDNLFLHELRHFLPRM